MTTHIQAVQRLLQKALSNALIAAYIKELASGEHTRCPNDHAGALSLYIETREHLKHDYIKVRAADYPEFKTACDKDDDDFIQAFEDRTEAQMVIAERCIVDYIVSHLKVGAI